MRPIKSFIDVSGGWWITDAETVPEFRVEIHKFKNQFKFFIKSLDL